MDSFLLFIAGFLFGYCFTLLLTIIFKIKPSGFLRIDRSDPEEPPYLFLELTEDIPSLLSKEKVIFQVKAKDYISRK